VAFKHIVHCGIYRSCLCKKNDTACFAVKSMHNANVRRISQRRIFFPQITYHCGMKIVPVAGNCLFCREERRFVHNDNRIVLKEYGFVSHFKLNIIRFFFIKKFLLINDRTHFGSLIHHERRNAALASVYKYGACHDKPPDFAI